MPEATEYQLGEWHIDLKPQVGGAEILDREEKLMAFVPGSLEEVLPRAMLIARAPSLRDAVAASLAVFRVMAEHGTGRGQLAAQDMIPSLECTLFGLETAGT